jgi:ribosomal protein L29
MTMTTTGTQAPVRERRRHQREVEQLLDQIRRQMTELRRLKAAGAVGKALSDRKHRLEQTRRQLASLTSASSAV